MEAATSNFFQVTDTVVGEWVEIPAPLLSERLLQYIQVEQHHQLFITLKDEHIRHLSSLVTFYIQKIQAATRILP